LKRNQRIFHGHKLRPYWVAGQMVSAHYGCYGASGQCLVNEIVAIQPFASDCEESSPGRTVRESIEYPSAIALGSKSPVAAINSAIRGKRQIHFYPAPVA